MNVNVKNGLVTVTSDTRGEALELFEWYMNYQMKGKEETKVQSRKRPLHTKTCDMCGKQCKGASGLAIHKQSVHGVKGKSYLYNQRYLLKKKLMRSGMLATN